MTDYIKLPSELAEAEQFLDYCGIPYEPNMLDGKRIPLMLRFRFYLEGVELEGKITTASIQEECMTAIRWCLERAYRDVGGSSEAKSVGTVGSWAEGCLNTSACAACKSGCNESA